MSSSSRASPSAERYDRNDSHSSMKRRRLHRDIKLSSSSSCFSPCNSSSSSSSSCCVSDNLNHLSNYTQSFHSKCVTGTAKAASSLVESFHHETEASVKSRISLESCGSEAESSVGSSTGSFSVLHHRFHRHKHVHHRLHLHHEKDTSKLDEDEVQSRFRGVLIEPSAEGHVCGRVSDDTATEGGQGLKNARSCQDQHEEHGEQEEEKEENRYIDTNCGGGLGFDPNTVFRTTFFSNGDGDDDGNDLLFSCPSPDNTSWFLNELDSEGNAFLDEVLDQEWMTSAIANLERLNDSIDSCDSCVLHQLQEPWKHT